MNKWVNEWLDKSASLYLTGTEQNVTLAFLFIEIYYYIQHGNFQTLGTI